MSLQYETRDVPSIGKNNCSATQWSCEMPRGPSKTGASVRQHITTACTACRRSKIKVNVMTTRGSDRPLIGPVVRWDHAGLWTVSQQEP
ncbi:hypothetical protein E4T47_01056 [Aureobasidium subglaciale]|nr:hypothetical protein E4T47_01056 [Aureobasidium subglaciale]